MDIYKIRDEFPYLKSDLNKDLVYLDNAATSQKPQSVIDAVEEYYRENNANTNRGSYSIGMRSTQLYEEAREKLAKFINAEASENIIFVRNATEAINLVVYSYGLDNLKAGDEVLISIVEHHANLVNWQAICKRTGAKLKFFYLDDDFKFDLEDYRAKLNENTKVVAFTAASNVLSFKVPIKKMVKMAKDMGAIVLLDGAQYTSHERVDVQDLGCDFYALSGHKMFAPMGIGALYGKRDLLESMSPFLYGGGMINYVYEEKTLYASVPEKFEAGTQNVAGAVGLSKAIDFINKYGIEKMRNREHELTQYCAKKMKELTYLDLYYPKKDPYGTNVLFNVKGVHPHDVTSILDFQNVAIKAGHHCTQPLHRYLGINSSCRVSIACYNTEEEIDRFIVALGKVKELMIDGA